MTNQNEERHARAYCHCGRLFGLGDRCDFCERNQCGECVANLGVAAPPEPVVVEDRYDEARFELYRTEYLLPSIRALNVSETVATIIEEYSFNAWAAGVTHGHLWRGERPPAAAPVAQLMAWLSDSNAVYVAILRGEIALTGWDALQIAVREGYLTPEEATLLDDRRRQPCSVDCPQGSSVHEDACPRLAVPVEPKPELSEREKIYAASRASVPERPAMWRGLRCRGYDIVSSWINEAGPGETASMTVLWDRLTREIQSATRLVLYVEPDDFPLKGALVEVGIALGCGIPVYVVAPDVKIGADHRPLGSWCAHPLVTMEPNLMVAMGPLAGGANAEEA